MSKIVTLFIFLLFLFFYELNVFAQIQRTEASGEATIFQGDISAAREIAIIDALREAVKNVTGIIIQSQRISSRSSMLDNTTIGQVNGFVKRYVVTDEKQERGIYRVKVLAEVDSDIENSIENFIPNLTAVAGIETIIDNQVVENDLIENFIIEQLVNEDFKILDKEQLLATQDYNYRFPTSSQAARELGRKYLTNIVITGTVNAKLSETTDLKNGDYFGNSAKIVCYRTRIHLRAFETTSSEIIASYQSPMNGVKGFGSNAYKAQIESISEASFDIDEKFLQKVIRYAKGKKREVHVMINNIPDHNAFLRIKNYIQGLRFRESPVKTSTFIKSGVNEFSFEYIEKSFIISAFLQRNPRLEVQESSWNRIVCNYIK